MAQPPYPSGRHTPAEVIQILSALKTAFSTSHEFWNDDLSLADTKVFNATLIAGPRNVTDVYLLRLAAKRKGTLISFDRTLPWQAIDQGAFLFFAEYLTFSPPVVTD